MTDNRSHALGAFVAFVMIPNQYAAQMAKVALGLNSKCQVTAKRIEK